ncbi:uracil-DNA glycosylase-like protein [Suillus subalutaceus]|uniref:uracil-DNA glycosylase-like protein n=1 Tax=Suillus subalutaceus TaxID=48586 RepID=UPI001B876F94|nr:uracil-DNA glycosylase-like protein [Suillus subalutaceus]KAG1840815.1 uracil-DNA glycosylase-like protein [Suillus subalutaceus]
MSFEEDRNDGEASVTENFRESVTKFTFSTPCQPQLGPAVATVHSSELPTLRRSSRVAAVATSRKPGIKCEVDALISTSPGKGKRKAPNASLSKNAVKKLKRGYAPPEAYAHLSPLTDYLAYGLDVVFCGINPGYMSAQRGHHFAHPSNHFWKCLHQSGFTPRLLPPSEDSSLPQIFNIGLTDLVDRPSAEAAELSSSERVSSVPILLNKLALHRPRFLCLVGISNWEILQKALLQMTQTTASGSKASQAPAKNIGLQPFKLCYSGPVSDTSANISETLLFVVPSTSGLVTQYQLPAKVEFFAQLKSLVDRPPSELDTSEMKCIAVPHNP